MEKNSCIILSRRLIPSLMYSSAAAKRFGLSLFTLWYYWQNCASAANDTLDSPFFHIGLILSWRSHCIKSSTNSLVIITDSFYLPYLVSLLFLSLTLSLSLFFILTLCRNSDRIFNRCGVVSSSQLQLVLFLNLCIFVSQGTYVSAWWLL